MSEQNIIAIICDCDGTLCPDTTELLISRIGERPTDFWSNVSQLVQSGWDPPLAYLTKLLKIARSHSVGNITLDFLKEVGHSIKFYPGSLDFIERLQHMLDSNADFRAARVKIELFINSSGIEEIIRFSEVGKRATGVFGCSFRFDKRGVAQGIKRTVTFTEKTKFVFAINKGIGTDELREKPYRVNDVIEPEDRRVPFEHMIYIGDGPSDIPCFSMIRSLDGNVVGVMPPEDTELIKPYELSKGERLTIGPYTADYSEGTDLYKMLSRYVNSIADSILVTRAQKVRRAPSS
ncbi:HAD family hydrolase [Chloroflexota bacterium]